MPKALIIIRKVGLDMLSNEIILHGEIRNNVNFEDFATVFKVFSYGPFFEDWSPEMVYKKYNSFHIKDGFVFGYYLDGKCVAILTLRPFIPGEHPVSFASNSKTMYLSDIATLPAYRCRGIGTTLMLHSLQTSKALGYKNIYLRSNEKSISMLFGIAKRCGFSQIWDLCEEVDFPRVNPYIANKDLRIFMAKEL